MSSIDEQVSRLKQWAKTTQCLVPLVRHGVGAEKADWQIPEGMPDTVKVEGDIPLGMGETTINHEWRRISTFFTPGSPFTMSVRLGVRQCGYKFSKAYIIKRLSFSLRLKMVSC